MQRKIAQFFHRYAWSDTSLDPYEDLVLAIGENNAGQLETINVFTLAST